MESPVLPDARRRRRTGRPDTGRRHGGVLFPFRRRRDSFLRSNQADIHARHVFKAAAARSGGKPIALTSGPTIGCYPVALASGKSVAFLSATARQPMSVALVPAAGGKTQIVAPRALPEKFPLDDLVIPELVVVKAPDGLEIPCQLFLPKGARPGDRRPGIVFTHGGPGRQMLLGWHYMEFYAEAYGINQYFANQGFVVISINYRSGIGYGRRFRMPPDSGRRGASSTKIWWPAPNTSRLGLRSTRKGWASGACPMEGT